MGKRFRYWFVNVFWYHYRAAALITVFAVLAGAWLLNDWLNNPVPDLSCLVISDDVPVDNLLEDMLSPYLSSAISDLDNDGEVMLYCSAIWLSPDNNAVYADVQRMGVTLMDDQFSMLLVFESSLQRFREYPGAEDAYMDLSQKGYATAEALPWLADISASKIWQELGLPQGTGVYLAVRNIPDGESGKRKYAAARFSALACLDRFLTYTP